MFTIPAVDITLTPRLRVFVNGCDRTSECAGVAAVTLTRLGEAVGWARRQFSFGVTRAEGTDITVLTPVCSSVWRTEGGEAHYCKLPSDHSDVTHSDGMLAWVYLPKAES